MDIAPIVTASISNRRHLWLKINSLSKRYSMMKMETLYFVKITARHEKKHRSSRIWPILAMPDFLAKVKRKLLQRSLNTDTKHYFL